MPLTFWKKIIFRCILVLMSFVIVLTFCEVAVRIWVASTNRIPLTISDAHTGWVLSPNLRNQVKADADGHYVISTNDDGYRLTTPEEQSKPETIPVVILVGDSFVQGVGVDDNETFAWLLARDTPWTIVNLGVLGYGTHQELLSLTGYLKDHPNLEVRDIVVFVFDNDFIDVQTKYERWFGRNRPHFQVINGRLQPEAYNLEFSDYLTDVSYFYGFFNTKLGFFLARNERDPDPADGVDVVTASLNEMRNIAAQRKARFHILVHSDLKNSEPFRQPIWDDYMRLSGVTDITERLRLPDVPNPVGYDKLHWSAEGHRRVAAIVQERLDY